MGKAIRAYALALLLAGSANAGIIQFGVKESPPPPPTESTTGDDSAWQGTGVMVDGSPESMAAQETSAGASLLVHITLNLLTLF